jgi:hypothetical protein
MRSRFFINRLSRFLFLLLIFTQNHFSTAQENKPHQDGIQVALKKGVLVPHRVVMRHLLQGHANGLTVGWMRQTLQGEEWHHTYRQPQYGVKFNYMDIGNREVLGTSWSIAGNTFIPFWRHNRFALQGHLGLGLNYMTKRFDQAYNPKNNAISSHLNSFVLLGKAYEYAFSNAAIRLEVEMAHVSNGATKLPNLGLNVVNVNLGATYYFDAVDLQVFKKPRLKTDFKASHHWKIFGTITTKQYLSSGSPNYLVGGTSLFWHRHWKRKAAFEVALDFFQNGSLQRLEPESTWMERMQMGLYTGYVLPINKLHFTVGMGYYIKNDFEPDGPFYHRFGTRYQFNDRWVGNLTIKSHWGKADYFEYGVFYMLGRNEK